MTTEGDRERGNIASAVEDFRQARQKAALESLLGALTGKSTDLMPYDQVRKHLRPLESANRQLQDIPLDAIVGSVNRYTDFSRSFLPLNESDRDRWARVRVGVDSLQGLPPIEVYQVGAVYFVLDGHHRVSVMRQLGNELIQAYVTPVTTRVPLSPGDQPDDLIIKAEYSDFLSQTRIDELRPQANLILTAPGQYAKLLEHISAHRYLMGIDENRAVSNEDAITHWYDTVYQPVANLIHERNLLRDFPDRTETDLYLWIMENRSALGGHQLGWEAQPETVVEYLRSRFGASRARRVPRVLHRLQDWLVPDPLEPGPPTGSWRREHASHPHRSNRMFDELLVTVVGSGSDDGREAAVSWSAVDMAIAFAQREEARLTGLHIVNSPQEQDSPAVQELRAAFEERCAQGGVAGRLLVESGPTARMLFERSYWTDLLIFQMEYPPPSRTLARLRSGTRTLIRRSNSPLLAVPEGALHSISSALLAYSGAPKSDEALFLATYLAERWQLQLTVISVLPSRASQTAPLERAKAYLEEHHVQATYLQEFGEPARVLSLASEQQQCDLILMGAYEGGLLREATHGSTVDRVLRTIHRPVLICS